MHRVAVERASRCPLWVKSRHRKGSGERPLYPQKRTSVEAAERNRAGCVLAIANGMTAEQEFPGRNPPSTQIPAKSWLILDSRGAHFRFGILARAESILPPLPDNHWEL